MVYLSCRNQKETHGWGILNFWTFSTSSRYLLHTSRTNNSDFGVRLCHRPSDWGPKQVPTQSHHFTHLILSGSQTWLAGKCSIWIHGFPVQMHISFGDRPSLHVWSLEGKHSDISDMICVPLNQYDFQLSYHISCHSCSLVSWCYFYPLIPIPNETVKTY